MKEVRQTISVDSIKYNWELAKQDKVNEFSSIAYSQLIDDDEIEKLLNSLKFSPITK